MATHKSKEAALSAESRAISREFEGFSPLGLAGAPLNKLSLTRALKAYLEIDDELGATKVKASTPLKRP